MISAVPCVSVLCWLDCCVKCRQHQEAHKQYDVYTFSFAQSKLLLFWLTNESFDETLFFVVTSNSVTDHVYMDSYILLTLFRKDIYLILVFTWVSNWIFHSYYCYLFTCHQGVGLMLMSQTAVDTLILQWDYCLLQVWPDVQTLKTSTSIRTIAWSHVLLSLTAAHFKDNSATAAAFKHVLAPRSRDAGEWISSMKRVCDVCGVDCEHFVLTSDRFLLWVQSEQLKDGLWCVTFCTDRCVLIYRHVWQRRGSATTCFDTVSCFKRFFFFSFYHRFVNNHRRVQTEKTRLTLNCIYKQFLPGGLQVFVSQAAAIRTEF